MSLVRTNFAKSRIELLQLEGLAQARLAFGVLALLSCRLRLGEKVAGPGFLLFGLPQAAFECLQPGSTLMLGEGLAAAVRGRLTTSPLPSICSTWRAQWSMASARAASLAR